jgi:hypothetical protein
VSHARYITVLSHHQPIGSRSGTAILAAVADELVQRMAAEKISSKVIRMMAPDSVFLPALQVAQAGVRYIPAKLSSGEIGGTLFRQPSDPAWRDIHRAAIRSVQTRAYMAYKAWAEQFKTAVLPAAV